MGLSFPILAQNDELCDDSNIKAFGLALRRGGLKIIFKKIA